MTKPSITLGPPKLADGSVEFEGVVAGHRVSLLMSREYVEDNIGDRATEKQVADYFAKHADDIEKAVWVLAYADSIKGMKPNDPPSAVPYIAVGRAPFSQIKMRRQ